jgi:hypothetical protein
MKLNRIYQKHKLVWFAYFFLLSWHGQIFAAQIQAAGWQQQRFSDGKQVYTPLSPAFSEKVKVSWYPPVKTDQISLKRWFETKMTTSNAPQGQWVDEPSIYHMNDMVSYAERQFQPPNHSAYILKAFAIKLPDQPIQLGSIILANTPEVIDAYAIKSEQLMAELIASLTPSATSSNAATPPQGSQKQGSQTQASQAKRDPRRTPANQGLKQTDIEAVTYRYHSEMNYDGYYEDRSGFYLLLDDGSYYTSIDIPPADFDAAFSKINEPDRWGLWETREGSYYSKDGKNLGSPVPAANGSPIYTALKHTKYWGSMMGAVGRSTKYLTLYADGTFEKAQSSYALGSGNGHSVAVSAQANKHGSHSSGSGSSYATGASSSSVVTSSQSKTVGLAKDKYGTYQLKGYTLELNYADGDTTRSVFFFTDAKKENAYWNGRDYQSLPDSEAVD